MIRPSITSLEACPTTAVSEACPTTAVSEARLWVAARRAARRQHIGVTFGPNAQVISNELGTFVEGSVFYKVEGC